MALGPGPAGLKFWSPPGITADNTADINNLPASVGEQFNPWGRKRPVQDWVWGNPCLYPSPITFPAAAGSYALTGSDAALTRSTADTTNLPAGITNWFNPWGRKRPVQDWFRGPIPAVPVTLPAGSSSYSLTGTAAALAFGHVAASSSYSITGSAAALALGHVAGAGSYTLTGSNAALALGLGAGAGSYILTGAAAGLVMPFTLTAVAGSYTLTGSDAGLVIPGVTTYLPAGITGNFNPWGRPYPISLRTIAGRALSAPTSVTLPAAAGSYALTGATAALTVTGSYLPAGMTGSYAPWGRPPRQDWIWSVAYVSGVTGTTLSAGAGAYALSGSAAGLTATNFQYIFRQPLITRLWARSRWVAVSAQNWVTRSQRLGDVQLPANAGSYAVTGSSAGWALALTANAGSYTLTGFATVPLTGLGAAAGSYALTGATAGFIGGGTGVVLTAAVGSYAIIGTAAVLATAFPFSTASGSYALTGAAANLATPGFLVAGAGAYAITGTDAQLVQAGTITLTCGSGSYLLTGGAAVSFISAAPPTVEQPGGYTGGVSRGRMIRRRKRGELDIEPPPDLEPPPLSPYPPDLKPPVPGPKPPDLLPPQPSLLASMPQVKPAKILPALEDDEDEDEIALLLELLSRL